MKSILSAAVIIPVTLASGIMSLRGSASSENGDLTTKPQHRQLAAREPTFPGTSGLDFKGMKENIRDLWEPFDKEMDTAVFSMVPKSGTTTLESYMSACLHMVTVSDMGKDYVDDSLEVISLRNNSYVNVNTMRQDGIAHADELNLARNGLADVVITRNLHQVAEQVFSPSYKGRLFTLMRDPVDRVASLYYQFLKKGENEPTLSDFASSPSLYLDNYSTRQLVGKSLKGSTLTMQDLEDAKIVLAHKVLIGLSSNYIESIDRFTKYFGWKKDAECLGYLLNEGGRTSNPHPKLEPGLIDRKAIEAANQFDVLLYEFAEGLFEQQGRLFEDTPLE